jgi:hypothetical protein
MGRWAILTAYRRVGVSAYRRMAVWVGRLPERISVKWSLREYASTRQQTFKPTANADTPKRRYARTPIRPYAHTLSRREAGVSLVEMSIALVLFTTVAVFGFQTIMAGWILQNSAIMQSMTDARAGIETAYAQRWVFAAINSSDVEAIPNPTKTTPYTLWPVYPASITSTVTIGSTPKGPVNATVVRTCHQYTDPLTRAQSYMLESYVVYQDKLRQYCKLSKVYRSQ